MDARNLGAQAERRAEAYLRGRGFEILERNYRAPCGELDLVAREGKILVFVEVRSRASDAFGGAQESIGAAKRKRWVKTARLYLEKIRWEGEVRFDVVAFNDGRLTHIPEAFHPQAPGF